MKIFYSGALNHVKILERNDIKNILISIYGIKDIFKKIKNQEWMIDGTRELIIDNGAFSAWNSGSKIISVEDYVNFVKKFHAEFSPLFKNIYYIGLDNIPGEKNKKPSYTQIKKSCELTFSNFKFMIDEGCKNILPVVHQFEDVQWIKEYEQYTDFICLSPANDQSNKSRAKWLDEAFNVINKTTKTHGLAVTGKVLLEKHPWYSADSISWIKPFIFGWVYYWDFYTLYADRFNDLFGDKSTIWSLKKYEIFLSYFNENLSQQEKAEYHIDYHIKNYQLLESYITQLWQKRGITWE